MSGASSERVAALLAERFARTPVLTWRDPAGEYREQLDAVVDAVSADGLEVTVHRVEGNELGVKTRIYRLLDAERAGDALEATDTRQLIYRAGEPPARRDNWLLDLEVGYGIFTADTVAILVHDLGLADRGVDDIVATHLEVFAAPGRVDAIRERLNEVPPERPSDLLADDVRAFLCAEVLGLTGPVSHRLHSIVTGLFEDHVAENDSGYQALGRAGLDDFLWQGCARIYGYTSDTPSVAGLATWLFHEAWQGWPEARSPARIDFERLRDDRSHRQLFTELAEIAQGDLNIAERLQTDPMKLEELVDYDIFPIIDEVILSRLAAAIVRREIPQDAVGDIVGRRSTTTWFDDHRHAYRALESAADCLALIDRFNPVIADAADGVRSYGEKWAQIDQAYRLFRSHVPRAETELPAQLADLVERHYVHDYQRPLAAAWQTQVDALERWEIPGIESLTGFARYDLVAKAKTLVVVSDALRYEVGLELAERMNADNWFSATIEPRMAPLPSITGLGMAAMLPHDRLELVDADNARADGTRTSGLDARRAAWQKINIAAVGFDEVMAMGAAERGALWSNHEAVVVYHDTIDRVGHESPGQTPDACDRALDDIALLVKRFGSGKMRASRVLVTADHGFLYQASDLQDDDFLSERGHGEQVTERRRYVVGHGLRDHPAFTTWTPEQLGLDGDLEVQVPRGLHRLRIPGGGYQYVHGGSSLQEIVVPLVTLTQSRSSGASKVTVDVNVSTPTITSSTVLVTLLQREAVSGKRRGRELVIGVYSQDGKELLSGERTVIVASTADDVRDRSTTVELVLSEEAERHNGETVIIRADELINGTPTPYRNTTATLQRGFGAFFDPL